MKPTTRALLDDLRTRDRAAAPARVRAPYVALLRVLQAARSEVDSIRLELLETLADEGPGVRSALVLLDERLKSIPYRLAKVQTEAEQLLAALEEIDESWAAMIDAAGAEG